jgi:hypothetical protein
VLLFCRTCGSTHQAISRFCIYCETKLVASASSSETPKNGLSARFNRPLRRVVTIALVLILFFALFASYQMKPGNGGTTEPSGNGDAAESSLGKHEQEQAALLRGIDIDYDSFYAEARATGLKIGQRYRFTAAYDSGKVLYQNRKSLRASPAFDDQAQYTEFLKGNTSASRTIVASMGEDGKIYVNAIE